MSSSLLPGDTHGVGTIEMVSILVSGLLGICCYLIAGNSLDLFVGGILFACLLAPPLASIAGQLPGAAGCSIAIALGIGGSWAIAVWERAITIGQGATCLLVLCTLLAAASFGVLLLIRLGCSRMASSAIVTIAVLAWLSFPIWMSGALLGSSLHWSVLFHPLFAINGILPPLGIWTEQQVAYGLTNVGQDVQYQLPHSAWPVIGFQSGLALVMLAIRGVLKDRSPVRGQS